MADSTESSSARVEASKPATVLGVASFRFLLGSTSASSLGASVTTVAVSWLVYHATGSTIDIAFVGLAELVPGIVFGLFAGVLADRHNRRRLMLASDISRAIIVAGLVAALYLIGFSLAIVLVVMILIYTFTALFNPASQAMLPKLVPITQLEDANGLLAASGQLSTTIGAGIGGLLVASAGAAAGLGVNVVTYVLSATLVFQIAASFGTTRGGTTHETRSFRREFVEGFAYMRQNRGVLAVTLGFMAVNFFLILVPIFLVVYSATVIGHGAAAYGYLVAALSMGAVVGALTVGRIRARRFAGVIVGVSFMGLAGGVGLLLLSGSILLSIAGVFLFGFSIGLVNTVYFATMQAIVPNEILARVLSIDAVGSNVAAPVGIVAGGVLANAYGILFTYSIAGTGCLVIGLAMLAIPSVRALHYGGSP